jgi:hypothetical protein
MLIEYDIDILKDYITGISINTNTNQIKFTDEEIYSFNLEESCCSDNKLSVGNAISNTLTLKLVNTMSDGTKNTVFDNNFKGTRLEVKAIYSNDVEVPLGTFFADDVSKEGIITTLTAYDRLGTITYAIKYNSLLNWEDDKHSLREIAKEIEPNSNYSIIPESILLETKPDGYTKREMLGYIAGCCGLNVRINRLGVLEFFSLGTNGSRAEITPDITYSLSVNDNVSVVNALYAQLADGDEDSCSNDDIVSDEVNAIEVEIDNPIMTSKAFYYLWDNIEGFTYRAINYSGLANPLIEVGDKIIITDEEGNTFDTVVFSQEFSYNGNFTQSIETTTEGTTHEENNSRPNSTDNKVNATVTKAVDNAVNNVINGGTATQEIITVVKQDVVAADMIEATSVFSQNLFTEYLETNIIDYKCIPNLVKEGNSVVWAGDTHTYSATNTASIRGYVKAKGISLQFIEAHLVKPSDYKNMTTDEVVSLTVNSKQVYYTSILGGNNAYQYFTFVSPKTKYPNMSDDVADMYKVMIRKTESEYIKLQHIFVLENDTYNIVTQYGVGDDNGRGVYQFSKDSNGGELTYIERENGAKLGIRITDTDLYKLNGSYDATIIPTTAVLNSLDEADNLPEGAIVFIKG